MTAFLYRWLPRLFYCHCRPDRSFFWRGRQFPICARCTGQLVGLLLGIPLFIVGRFPLYVCAALLLPLIADGFLQLLTRYESTNPRRFITGTLFGLGLYELAAWAAVQAVSWGYALGTVLRERWIT